MTVKVLIVEDNPVAHSFLCRVMRQSFSDAHHITEAGDLETARRHIALTGGAQGLHGVDPFKLILVDLELPDGNALELLVELTHYPATKIVTTLYSDDDQLFPALQCSADGYLLKEDRFEVLVEELQRIVRGQPPLSPAIARRLPTRLHERLTPRENEVLTYPSKVFTIKEIASLMGIKWFTVNDHIKSIFKKLNVSSRAEAAVLASKQGWFRPEQHV